MSSVASHEIRRAGPRVRCRGVRHRTPSEGNVILDHPLRHASSPDNTIRFGWDPGDFVLRDNRAPWHYAADDHGDGALAYRNVIGVGPARQPAV
ncbi:TauD/TfdA family dioxygenase [Streptomyces sp. Root1310]|uniref:TauD/TfdA family dioxygenase n=1 Tax=Streptomyces sp. Root1310 TaxID=1736452 RepID=UPI000B0DA857|nr:TauD/TfdA family dioxygenase [Streptomyces sp. Root1310]